MISLKDLKIFKKYIFKEKMDKNNSDIKPTSLRISTMTATCKINSNINLEEAAKMFIEIIKDTKDIKYIEHGKTTAGVSNKNISEKKAAKKKVPNLL